MRGNPRENSPHGMLGKTGPGAVTAAHASRLLSGMAASLLATAWAPAARAQSVLSGDEQNVVNFAFATQLGSGIYSVSGRTLQIYRLPLSHTLQSADDAGPGIRLTLPVTFGFFDFELQDIEDDGLPTQVDSLSFVPGLRFDFEVAPGWTLEPYAEAGIARADDANAHANVYAAGVASLYEFDGQGFDWLLRNDLTWAGVDVRGTSGQDRFVRLQTVLTASRSFGQRSSADCFLYALNEYYADQPGGPIDSALQEGNSMQYELGVTFGWRETRRVWKIPLPRIGIGYRFGSNLDVVRVVIGAPY